MVEIRTLTGTMLDVYPNATIEVNMGGISLLDLSSRTATYTNSFDLPRTPTNESVFAFASQPTRNNRPSINVWITKGLFQRKAVLKVLEFEDEYKCTLSYDLSVIDNLSTQNFYLLPEDGKIIYQESGEMSDSNRAYQLCLKRDDGSLYVLLGYNRLAYGGAAFMTTTSFLTRVNELFGYTFSGSILLQSDFLNFAIYNNWFYLLDNYDLDSDTTFIEQRKRSEGEISAFNFVSCATILKLLSQIFAFDIKIDGTNIELNPINTNLVGISIETLKFEKNIVIDIFNNGYIKYNVIDKTVGDLFGSDVVLSYGIKTDDILKIESNIPYYYSGTYSGYDFISKETFSKVIAMASINGIYRVKQNIFDGNINANIGSVLPMTGFYSNVLNPIFANLVILKANGYLDPLTADNIMTTRVINSVQLGGRYWVDTMAYNLTTGQSKMTLIKLP